MIKTRGKNQKSNKNVNLNPEQDNEPAKLTGMAAELAGEPVVLAEEQAETESQVSNMTEPRGRRNTMT